MWSIFTSQAKLKWRNLRFAFSMEALLPCHQNLPFNIHYIEIHCLFLGFVWLEVTVQFSNMFLIIQSNEILTIKANFFFLFISLPRNLGKEIAHMTFVYAWIIVSVQIAIDVQLLCKLELPWSLFVCENGIIELLWRLADFLE